MAEQQLEDIELEVKNDEIVKKDEEIEIEAVEDDNESLQSNEDKQKRVEIPLELGIEELRQQLNAEKRAKEEAERAAREAREDANRAKSEADDTNLLLLEGAIKDIKRETHLTKQVIREAFESGDYEKATELQEILANHVNRLQQLERGKAEYETRIKQPRNDDPVEAFASQLSPKSAEWIRKNPNCVTDPRLNQKMVAAHNLALADGIKADTDEYFSFVEDILKIRREEPVQARESRQIQENAYEEDDAMSTAAKPTQRRSAPPPPAPVSRSAGSGQRPNVVRLTAQEREMAHMMGMDEKEYAKNKLTLIKEGKLK